MPSVERKYEVSKLKLCPFCGREFSLVSYDAYTGSYSIHCPSCQAYWTLDSTAGDRSRHRAVEAWNKRATDDYEGEFLYMFDFAREHDGGDGYDELFFEQLRALWTAYCLHNNFIPDTKIYDERFMELYNMLDKNQLEYNKFNLYMCKYLV